MGFDMTMKYWFSFLLLGEFNSLCEESVGFAECVPIYD